MANHALSQRKKSLLFTGELVTITAGSGESIQSFRAHADMIKKKSAFFRAALNGKWKEARDGRINLPEDIPEVIDTYIYYLYAGRIPPDSAEKEETSSVTGEKSDAEVVIENTSNGTFTTEAGNNDEPTLYTHRHLIFCSVFGEKIQDDNFSRVCQDEILTGFDVPDKWSFQVENKDVKQLYDSTGPISSTRKFVVDVYILKASKSWFGKDLSDHHPQFLLDVASAMAESRKRPRRLSVQEFLDLRRDIRSGDRGWV